MPSNKEKNSFASSTIISKSFFLSKNHVEVWDLHVHACMLSHFSHIWHFATLWTVAHQGLLSMGFSRQELKWVVMPSSRESSRPRDWTHISYVFCIGRQVLYHCHYLQSPQNVHTAIFKMDNQQGQYSPGISIQCYVTAWMGGELGEEWILVYVWLSPCSVLHETITSLLVSYTPI